MNRPHTHLLALLASLLTAVAAQATPADRQPFVYTQPDGRQYTLLLIGDEHAHQYMTADSILVTIDRQGYVHTGHRATPQTVARQLHQRRARRLHDGRPSRRTDGDDTYCQPPRGLIILANFADCSFVTPTDYIQRMMNEEGFDGTGSGVTLTGTYRPVGSAYDYFCDQSDGRYRPVFDVIGPIELDQPYSYYGANLDNDDEDDQNPEEMIVSAVRKLSEQHLADLADYDSNGDGLVDMVYVIYAGYGEADGGGPNTIWPHMWDIRETRLADETIDGLHLGLYACSSELKRGGQPCGIGTFCHEFGHCLGLPDLYDIDYSGGFGLGSFDIMSGGNYNGGGHCPPAYSAFERYSLGWLQYEEPADSLTVTLPDIKDSNRALRLTSTRPQEYFTLENRQQTGWDRYLPCSGLMIQHIDYDEEAWTDNTVNDDPDHPRVTIMPADGRLDRTTTAGDLFPGSSHNRAFTDDTNPSSRLWDGTPLQKPVTDIHLTNGIITFDYHDLTDAVSHPVAPPRSSRPGRRIVLQSSVPLLLPFPSLPVYNLKGQRVPTTAPGPLIVP